MQTEKKPDTLKTLRQYIAKADNVELVSLLDRADKKFQATIFRLLPPERAEQVFTYLEPTTQASIIQRLDNKKAIAIVEKMEPDDRARLFNQLPADFVERFSKGLSHKERRATALLMQYPEETAGRIMSPFFVALYPSMTVQQALEKIREQGTDAETIYVLPVIDETSQLLKGIVDLDRLVMEKAQTPIDSLMTREFRDFSVLDDQEDVARFIQSSDKLAVPIVDDNQKLRGIVTIDDAMDIMQMEETEDIIRGGASEPLGGPYLTVSVFRLVQIRVIWIILLTLAGILTVNVLQAFEATLSQEIALALFVPLLIGIGGNIGSQSATTIVRALAMDHVRTSDFVKVAMREMAVGALIGIVLGLGSYMVLMLVFPQSIAAIVAISLVCICTVATFTGSLMPMLAKVLQLDPAVVSTPFVATVIDATGLIIYFMIARLVLGM